MQPHTYLECRPMVVGIGKIPGIDEEALVYDVWENLSDAHKLAWHNVCCYNSDEPIDVLLAEDFARKIETKFKELRNGQT